MSTIFVTRQNQYDPRKSERLELTPDLLYAIASYNGILSEEHVRELLLQGETVHTNFSLYRLDELGPEEERTARAIVSELERQDIFMLGGQMDWPCVLVDGTVDLGALVRAIRQTGEKT